MTNKIAVKLVFGLLLVIGFTNTLAESALNKNFAKGADISWLPQMEASRFKFYDDNGVQQDCFQILKDHDINTIRLRTWVNPSNNKINGHCSQDETIAMAVRAKKWGMRVMIDFHYSDTWADPGNQAKPAAWATHSFTELLTDVYDYTHNFMVALEAAGVTPEWVQVGNETPSGMLFPEGSTSNWSQLTKLINKGYEAVKVVSPTTKVVLHIDKGHDNARFRWWFDNAKNYGAKYDVIGMSYYPYWIDDSHPDYTLSINALGTNLRDMASRYKKEVMVVEIGGLDSAPENTKNMILAVINRVSAVPNSAGLGVIYWEPQGQNSWSGGYPLSAWGNGSRPQPTVALDAFITPIDSVDVTFKVDMSGQNTSEGVFIYGTLTNWLLTPMQQIGQTNIYATTLTLLPNEQYVYFFKNGSSINADTREVVPTDCAESNTTSFGWDGDRALFLSTNDTTITTIYGSCETINTIINPNTKAEIKVYPNPAHTVVNISLCDDMLFETSSATIFTLQGIKVIDTIIPSGLPDYKLKIESLNPGMYLLKITTKRGLFFRKIAVQ